MTIGLSVGVWRSGVLLAIVLGLVGYLVSPYVAHPRDAIGYRRRSRQYRTYLSAVASNYGRPVDLGP